MKPEIVVYSYQHLKLLKMKDFTLLWKNEKGQIIHHYCLAENIQKAADFGNLRLFGKFKIYEGVTNVQQANYFYKDEENKFF